MDNLQDVQEEGDNIHIQVDGSKDVLLCRKCEAALPGHHQLRVKDDVHSVPICISDDLKDHEEEVDNVDIEAESCKHVLLGRYAVFVVATQHKLCVKH